MRGIGVLHVEVVRHGIATGQYGACGAGRWACRCHHPRPSCRIVVLPAAWRIARTAACRLAGGGVTFVLKTAANQWIKATRRSGVGEQVGLGCGCGCCWGYCLRPSWRRPEGREAGWLGEWEGCALPS